MKPDYPMPSAYAAPQQMPARSNAPLIIGIVLGVLALCFIFVVLLGAVAFFTIRATAEAQAQREEARRAQAEAKMRELEADLDGRISGEPFSRSDTQRSAGFDFDSFHRSQEDALREHQQRMDEIQREMDERMKDMERNIDRDIERMRPPSFPR